MSRVIGFMEAGVHRECHWCRMAHEGEWFDAEYVDAETRKRVMWCQTCAPRIVNGIGLHTKHEFDGMVQQRNQLLDDFGTQTTDLQERYAEVADLKQKLAVVTEQLEGVGGEVVTLRNQLVAEREAKVTAGPTLQDELQKAAAPKPMRDTNGRVKSAPKQAA